MKDLSKPKILIFLIIVVAMVVFWQFGNQNKGRVDYVMAGNQSLNDIIFTIDFSNGEIFGDFHDVRNIDNNSAGLQEVEERDFTISGNYNQETGMAVINLEGTISNHKNFRCDVEETLGLVSQVDQHTVVISFQAVIAVIFNQDTNLIIDQTNFNSAENIFKIVEPSLETAFDAGDKKLYETGCFVYPRYLFDWTPLPLEDWIAVPIK